MDSRTGLVNFGLFIVIFAFAFTFCLLAISQQNTLFSVLSFIGYIVCISGAVFNGVLTKEDGGALSLWFFVYAGIVAVVFVWHITRTGTMLGWW